MSNENATEMNQELIDFLGEDSSTTETAKLGFSWPDAVYELKVTEVKFKEFYSEKTENNYLSLQIHFTIENVVKVLGKSSYDTSKLFGKKMVQSYYMNVTNARSSDQGRKEEDAKLNAVINGLGGDINLARRAEKISSVLGKISKHKLTEGKNGFTNFDWEDYKTAE